MSLKKKLFFSSVLEKKWMIKKFNLRKCDADITISWRDLFIFFFSFFFKKKLKFDDCWLTRLYDMVAIRCCREKKKWPLVWKISRVVCIRNWSLCSNRFRQKKWSSIWGLPVNTSLWRGRHVVIVWKITRFFELNSRKITRPSLSVDGDST